MTARPADSRPEWVDPDDAPELTDEDFDRGVWFDGREPIDELVARVQAKSKGGRPKSVAPKVSTTIRLDPDVLAHFKAGGPGWQTRLNETLRRAIATERDR